MKPGRFSLVALTLSMTLSLSPYCAHAKSYIAYISDSSNSSVVYWIAKEAGIFKKHGLDFETIFIDGSVRGIQSLLAGDLGYT
ncbi:MAG TPA: aliphatic sulfonates ABC transporter substrate-binding protein, partial [Candidatus Binatia bacterium]